jgi:hypothetical protein
MAPSRLSLTQADHYPYVGGNPIDRVDITGLKGGSEGELHVRRWAWCGSWL